MAAVGAAPGVAAAGRRPRFGELAASLCASPRLAGLNLVVLASVDSTNRLARRIVGEYFDCQQPVPVVAVVAHHQRAGRGRRGRRWESPAGCGVYASLALPGPPAAELGLLPLRTGAALARTLNGLVGGRCRLKWPNDLRVGGRKLGGILIEAVERGAERRAVIVGFGVNHTLPAAALRAPELAGATALAAEIARPPALAELAADLLGAVIDALGRTESRAEAVAAYRELSEHRPGDLLRCRVPGRTVEGHFLGIAADGSLRLSTDGGERRIAAAEEIES